MTTPSEVIDWICEPGIERSRIMTTPVECCAPWCRELEALLRHGPVRIHPEMDEIRVRGYTVIHVDDRAREGHSYRGQGPTLKDAIDDVVMKIYPQRE